MNKREIITIKKGYYFPFQLQFISFIGVIMSIIFMTHGSLVFGIVLLPMSLFFIFAPNGIQIDVTNKEYRDLPFVFGENNGWKSLENYCEIKILNSSFSKENADNSSGNNELYDIYIVSENSSNKIFIKRYNSFHKATKGLLFYADKLNLSNTKNNPEISDTTDLKR